MLEVQWYCWKVQVERERPWDDWERDRDRDRDAALGILLSPVFQSSPLRHQICECPLGFFNQIKAPGDFSPIQHYVNQKNHPAGPSQLTVPWERIKVLLLATSLVWFIKQQLITKPSVTFSSFWKTSFQFLDWKLTFHLRTCYLEPSSNICFSPHTPPTTEPIEGVGSLLAPCCPPAEASAPLKLLPSAYIPL